MMSKGRAGCGIRRMAVILALLISFVFPAVTASSFAASSVSIKGGDSVSGGETFTVTVTYSGGDVGMVNGQMSYDTGRLTYISGGSSSGNTGYIELKEAGEGGSIKFNLKFQAIAEGSTDLSVTTTEMYDMSGEYMDNPSASKTVSIRGNASQDELVGEEPDSEKPAEYEEPEGVDEMTDEEGPDTTVILAVSAGILLVIIGIISAVLIKKRKTKK